MNTLKTSLSCEIDDLIECVMTDTGKSSDQVEDEMWKQYIYPERTKTFVTTQFGRDKAIDNWLYESIYKILDENNIQSVYITESI
jgi:hypothetical protein